MPKNNHLMGRLARFVGQLSGRRSVLLRELQVKTDFGRSAGVGAGVCANEAASCACAVSSGGHDGGGPMREVLQMRRSP